jgi:thymidylate synthase (FAD)
LKTVLDHGFARLVSYMQPAVFDVVDQYAGDWTGDLEVIRNARVSYDADWRTGEDAGKDEKLLNYMHRNHHTSPFEGMVFTFEVKAPIFVVRQWHRHRTWSYNEVSARYAELPEEFYVPALDQITTQSESNKQMRTDEQHVDARGMQNLIHTQCVQSFHTYKRLIREGVPRELARGVLPMNTYTRMFATVDLHNLMHFLRLRLHPHAQYEIRVYAQALLDLIKPIVPMAAAALERELSGA